MAKYKANILIHLKKILESEENPHVAQPRHGNCPLKIVKTIIQNLLKEHAKNLLVHRDSY